MVEDVIKVQDQFYILATSALADDRTRVLKSGDTFAIFDRFGDVHHAGLGEQGVFHDGTRHLSSSVLRVDGHRPLLLSSTLKQDNAVLTVDLTNPDLSTDGKVAVPRGTVHIWRSKFLWRGVCYESLRFRNCGLTPLELSFTLRFDADFADIFEVRGLKRERTGDRLMNRIDGERIVLPYRGLDGVLRWTAIHCSPRPRSIDEHGFHHTLALEAKQSAEFLLTIACESEAAGAKVLDADSALLESTSTTSSVMSHDAQVYTANEQFNEWVHRAACDMYMMVTRTTEKLYPYAGVPWFSTVFGRDGIIAAAQYLWVNPMLARGVLEYLAQTQADEENPEQDAEPGKILHEQRGGEMAALGEHPFRRYYGTIDATPLFVMLAGAYYRRTGDRELIESIWPNIERAIEWIDRYGDRDGDFFVEYARKTDKGLVQQGWKDSNDSVFHADGRLADPPIALCEVQAYVYAAKRAAAGLAEMLRLPDKAAQLRAQAQMLRAEFERAFWSEELSTYVLALDGNKQPCKVAASNAGHCLMASFVSAERAERVARRLLEPDMFSGWGIRTVSADEVRYNPMSYHNGSVWPHDNSIAAYGMARYGHSELAAKVMISLFDAALFIDEHRLPELICGFGRRPGEGPTLYPVACSPQAWASGSAFLMLQACLGLSIDAVRQRITFHNPFLPECIPGIELKNLWVGDASVDVRLERHGLSAAVSLLRKHGKLEILTSKT